MKSLSRPAVSTVSILLIFYIGYSWARSYQEIHHLLTNDERELIFGHPFPEYVPEYDISHPVQVDESGKFLSRDLANGNARRKRDVRSSVQEPVYFKLSAFGQDFHLSVTLNHQLFSSNFEVEIRGNSSEFHYDIEHCHYIGQIISPEGKRNKVALSNCDGLQGLIRTPEDVLMVHPLPDRLGLEKNKTRAHVIHKRSLAPHQTLRRAMQDEKRSAGWCGVQGHSTLQQSDESESHMNYPRSSLNRKRTIESLIVVEKIMTKFYGINQIKKYVPTIVNMAHGLLSDASIGADIKYIIQKLLILQQDMDNLEINTHAASTLSSFCKWTTGQNEADDKNPKHFDHAALFSKLNFCRGKGNGQAADCGTILGLADLKGMCQRDTSCTLNKDTGLGTAFTLAHETAHNLGAEHDAEGNKCRDGVYIMATRASGKITAFDWSPCSRNYITNFLQTAQSKCLNDSSDHKVSIPQGLPGKLYNGDDQCVRMFGAGSSVCQMPEYKKKMCVTLHCLKPDGYCESNDEPAADGTICGLNDDMVCSRGKCLPEGKTGYQNVDGNWGAWGRWSACYPRCGGGLKKRMRKCNNPAPKHRGKLCEGKAAEYTYCTKKCPPNSENPRMRQCINHRHVQFEGGPFKWIYDPYYAQGSPKCTLSCATTNGDTTTFGNVKDGTPCSDKPDKTFCVNGQCKAVGCDGGFDSRAKKDRCGVCNGDGSSCSGGTINGNITPRPIKPKPASSGQLKTFTFNRKPGWDYYQTITTLPKGARNIEIQEVTASVNNLMLEDADMNNILNYDSYLSDYGPKNFRGAGTTFKFSKKHERETITARGPLTESLTLLFEANDDQKKYKVTGRYVIGGVQSRRDLFSNSDDFPELIQELEEVNKELSDAKKANQAREKTKTKWIMTSEGCSVTCGEGVETMIAVCVRDDDESAVGDQFCEEKRPKEKYKKCNLQRCPARWEFGPWTDCSKTCNDGTRGVRSREVFCATDSQSVEIEVKESDCKGPKPATYEECGTQPCPAEWYTVRAGACSTSCGAGVQAMDVKCVRFNSSGQAATVEENECTDIKPPTHVTCNADNPCNDDLDATN
ncbi:disintegrin and metalloproteinaseith thrombospondin motifs protein [Porites harrisoni]